MTNPGRQAFKLMACLPHFLLTPSTDGARRRMLYLNKEREETLMSKTLVLIIVILLWIALIVLAVKGGPYSMAVLGCVFLMLLVLRNHRRRFDKEARRQSFGGPVFGEYIGRDGIAVIMVKEPDGFITIIGWWHRGQQYEITFDPHSVWLERRDPYMLIGQTREPGHPFILEEKFYLGGELAGERFPTNLEVTLYSKERNDQRFLVTARVLEVLGIDVEKAKTDPEASFADRQPDGGG